MLPREEVAHLTVVHSGTSFEILRGKYVRQRFAPHLHDTYAIGVMESGAARCVARGRASTHMPGDLITIEPDEVHTGEPLTAEGWSYRMFYLPRDIMCRATGGDAPPRFASTCTSDPELAARLARVHVLLEQSADWLRQETALIHALHAMCTRHSMQPESSARAASPQALRRVRDFLESHYSERVCLADLAVVAEMSAFHLIRQFRRYYGVAPYGYLELIRVERAKLMLRGGAPISQVAFATGFSDQSHLTRQFKRVLGVTPGSYARSYRVRAEKCDELWRGKAYLTWHAS
jgi:AraC-type DNA-binding domain-containing proteins